MQNNVKEIQFGDGKKLLYCIEVDGGLGKCQEISLKMSTRDFKTVAKKLKYVNVVLEQ